MKKRMFLILLTLSLLAAGCGKTPGAETVPTEPPVTTLATEVVQETLPPETETPVDQTEYYTQVYAERLDLFYTALSEQWDHGRYFETGLAEEAYYYYEGSPLENAGYAFPDLDRDGSPELVIGAIYNADLDPAVFEIWTLVDGQPTMLLQGASRNHMVLQYVQEDDMWYVVTHASNSAANSATLCMMLEAGQLQVVQGITVDGYADPENPWFLTYDMDWDVSNDVPIDEATAMAILDSIRAHDTALEYIPFRNY